MGSIPGSGRSPGEGNGNPLPQSCLDNPMDRGAWWAEQSFYFDSLPPPISNPLKNLASRPQQDGCVEAPDCSVLS